MVITCKSCGKPVICQPSPTWLKYATARERHEQMKDYKCSPCAEAEFVKNGFSDGALAISVIEGRQAPWTPFGVEPDPKKFSRGKKPMGKTFIVSVDTMVSVEAENEEQALELAKLKFLQQWNDVELIIEEEE